MAVGITRASTKYVMVGGKCIMRITASWALETTGLYAIGLCEFEGGKYVCNVAYSDQIIAGAGDPKSGTMALKDITLGARWNTGDKIDVSLVKQPYDPLNIIGTQKIITVGACEAPCPTPTVSITSVSNRYPKSGETVDFTGYASGGTGHSIVSKEWDFGDGTSSTELNPSKAWTNNTGSSIEYTVTFTATNDCGKSKSSSTTITVSPAVAKNGIEIQFPSSLNGKQLIAHGAISTILGMWWTGPAVHGVLWTKGRVTWDNIDSSKKYVIQTGDACETSLSRESPDLCAGTFENGDDVVILVRNTGFDFRVYHSDDVYTLSGTSFNVLYLDETSGDIITRSFMGKVCMWLGIPTGSECELFWAEFYDPIFVANYLSIKSTGDDMLGNERTLTWIDHVAFIAAIIGSLPVLNIIPIGAVVSRIGDATEVIMRATMDLGRAEALKAGKALVDVCEHSPDTLLGMSKSELDELRAALVKVYGDLEGNRIIDDALTACGWFVRRHVKILDDFTSGVGDVTKTDIEDILNGSVSDVIDIFEGVSNTKTLITKLRDDTYRHVLGSFFSALDSYYYELLAKSESQARHYVGTGQLIGIEALKAADPAAMADIPKAAQDYASAGKIVEEVGENVIDEVVDAADPFVRKPHAEWQAAGKAQAKKTSEKNWSIWNGLSAFLKREKLYIMMALALSFTYVVLRGIYKYTDDDESEQATTSLSLVLFTKSLDQFFWDGKEASEDGRWSDLEAIIELYAKNIDEAEATLAHHETVQKENGTYDDFYECLMSHKFSLSEFRHDLDMATNRGTLRVTSNRIEFYAQLDEVGDPVYSWKTREVMFYHVPVGRHTAFIMKAGYTDCTTPSGRVTAGEVTTVHCDLVEEVCTPAVPSITAPSKAKVKESVSFRGSATTESAITYWYWDFGDGDDSRIQNPTHKYWKTGTYLVQLTVTDECGKVTTTHTIVIEEEAPPPEEEAATVYVEMPINSRTMEPLVWQDNPEVYVDGQYIKKAPGSISFGGWNEPEVKGCTLMVRATGYDDKSEWFALKDKDSLTWQPYMNPEGYVPPVEEHLIDFYIPEGASLTVTPITTVSRLVVGMRKMGRR